MKTKGENSQQQFIWAVKVLRKAGQFNHPMQLLLFDQMVATVQNIPQRNFRDASVLLMDVKLSVGSFPADFVQAVKDMCDAGILAESDKVIQNGFQVAFTPLHCIYTARLLGVKKLPSQFPLSMPTLKTLPVAALLCREMLNREFPDNALTIEIVR